MQRPRPAGASVAETMAANPAGPTASLLTLELPPLLEAREGSISWRERRPTPDEPRDRPPPKPVAGKKKENPTTYRWAVMRRPRGSRLHVEAGPEICRGSSALAVESLQHRAALDRDRDVLPIRDQDRKSTRLNSSH